MNEPLNLDVMDPKQLTPTEVRLIAELREAREEIKERGSDYQRQTDFVRKLGNELREMREATGLVTDLLAAARKDTETLAAFHKTALEQWSCFSGPGNEPCRLNESDDPNEICMYHLAVAVRNKLKGK